ncbi:hypothetical protein D3C78_799870 [compost metagenome]
MASALTGTTVTSAVSDTAPLSAAAVIVAVPTAIPVTTPLSFTLAMLSSLDVHSTSGNDALSGSTLATSCLVRPIERSNCLESISTLVTSIFVAFSLN